MLLWLSLWSETLVTGEMRMQLVQIISVDELLHRHLV
jgi:hypothetical protein